MRRYAPRSNRLPGTARPKTLDYRGPGGDCSLERPTVCGSCSLACFIIAVVLVWTAWQITIPGQSNNDGATLAAVTPLFSIGGVTLGVIALRRRERNVVLIIFALFFNICYLAACGCFLAIGYMIFGGVSGHNLH